MSVEGKLSLNPPAAQSAVDALAHIALPSDYLDFLARNNGGEGFLDNGAYAVLWKAEELVPFNADYQTRVYEPAVFLFGSDGGGESYAFDLRDRLGSVMRLPFIGMAMTEAQLLAESFSSFLSGSWVVGE